MYVQRTLRSIRDFQKNTTMSPLGLVHAGVAYLPNVSAGHDISGEVGQGGSLSMGQQPATKGGGRGPPTPAQPRHPVWEPPPPEAPSVPPAGAEGEAWLLLQPV